eukprot:COSAG05_NODE_10048_length_586_cov_0.944559_1_plen_69_part_10
MGLGDMEPNDLANLLTVGGAAMCSLMMVLFKSRCTKISICFGLWSCDRAVAGDDDEENGATNKAVNGNQ